MSGPLCASCFRVEVNHPHMICEACRSARQQLCQAHRYAEVLKNGRLVEDTACYWCGAAREAVA